MPEQPDHHLQSSIEQGVLVLTITATSLQGPEVAEALRREMLQALAAAGLDKIAIDFARVRYVSSTAFWPLIAVRRHLQETGGRILQCGLSKAIGDVFYTTRMVSAGGSEAAVFEMKSDVAEAVAYLNGPGAAAS